VPQTFGARTMMGSLGNKAVFNKLNYVHNFTNNQTTFATSRELVLELIAGINKVKRT